MNDISVKKLLVIVFLFLLTYISAIFGKAVEAEQLTNCPQNANGCSYYGCTGYPSACYNINSYDSDCNYNSSTNTSEFFGVAVYGSGGYWVEDIPGGTWNVCSGSDEGKFKHSFYCSRVGNSCGGGGGGGGGCNQACRDPEGLSCNSGIRGASCTRGNGQPGCWVEDCGSEVDPGVCNGDRIGCSSGSSGSCYVIYPRHVCHININKKGEQVPWYDLCCGCNPTYPATPILIYPTGGLGVDYSSVNLQWIASSSWGDGCPINNNHYKVYVGTTNPPTTVIGTVSSSQRNYQFTGNPSVPTYYWRVGANNGSRETYSETSSFGYGAISGQVFEDPNRQATLVGGVCQLSGASPIQPGAGSLVSVDGTYTALVDGSGNYAVAVPAGSGHVATLTVDPDQWTCTCPEDCAYGTQSPVTGLNYYVTNIRNAWFQVMGGSLHANGGNVASEIPSTCTGLCDPYLILSDAGGEGGLVSYTGSLNLGDQTAVNISQNSADWQAQTAYAGIQTGHDYFSRILNDDPNGLGIWASGAQPSDGVYNAQGVTRTDGTDWNILSGDQVVILVDGDLVIDNNINVASGGFLAIISSGTISIADDVTNVEGVYIADGDIATCESVTCGSGGISEQLNAEGIFVGWTGIELRRDFTTSDNNTNPAESFVYRPDLQVNAYRYLLNPKYTWQEVAP